MNLFKFTANIGSLRISRRAKVNSPISEFKGAFGSFIAPVSMLKAT